MQPANRPASGRGERRRPKIPVPWLGSEPRVRIDRNPGQGDRIQVRKSVKPCQDRAGLPYRESGAEPVMGQGRVGGPQTIEVALNAGGIRTLRGQTVIIDTGSRARMDDTPGLAGSRPLTHVEALDLDHLPEHLIVLGGGYVGLELAQAFRRFGNRVS